MWIHEGTYSGQTLVVVLRVLAREWWRTVSNCWFQTSELTVAQKCAVLVDWDRIAHSLLLGLSNHLWWKEFVPHTTCDKPFFSPLSSPQHLGDSQNISCFLAKYTAYLMEDRKSQWFLMFSVLFNFCWTAKHDYCGEVKQYFLYWVHVAVSMQAFIISTRMNLRNTNILLITSVEMFIYS